MTEESKQYISLHLSLFKQILKEEGAIFGIAIDKKDLDNSKLVITDKEKYLKTGAMDGVFVGLKELNEGLL